MSAETKNPDVAEIDPKIAKVTQAWKRVKKVEKEVADQEACLNEARKRLESSIVDAQHSELDGISGNDEFRKIYEHKREKIRRHRKSMEALKQSFKAEKELLKIAVTELEDIDKASKEEALPIIKGSKPVNEAWRDTPMEHLRKIGKNPLSETVVTKLVDAGYDTIGKLTDYKSTGSWYTDIDGIGKATSDKIDDAIEQFFAEWNTLAAAPAAEEESEDEPAPAVDLLAKPLSEVDGIPAAVVKSLAGEKIKTLADLQSKLKEMGEDGPLWLDCTVGKDEAQQVRESIKLLAA